MKKKPYSVNSLLLVAALLSACGAETPEALLASAKTSMAKKDDKAALIHLKNVLQKNPSLGEARFLMGKLLFEGGDTSAAVIELAKAESAGYSSNDLVVLSARIQLRQGEFEQLLARHGQRELSSPEQNSALQVVLAGAELATGRASAAEQRVKRALELQPDNVQAQLLQVSFTAKNSGVVAALKMLDKTLERFPTNDEAWLLRAALLVGTDRPGARKAYEQALHQQPRNLSAHAGLITLLLGQRDMAGVKDALERLQAVLPRHPQTKYFGAVYALETADMKTAVELTQALLKDAPQSPRINQLAGSIEYRKGSWSTAESYLNKTLLADPGANTAKLLLARVHIRAGDPGKALALLAPLLQASEGSNTAPENSDAYAVAGQAHLMQGDAKQAELLFSKAVSLDPKNVRNRTALALTQTDVGRYEQGIESLQLIAADDAGTAADMALIAVLIRKREYDKAQTAVDALERKSSQKSIAMGLRGQIELLQGRKPQAREHFEAAFKLDPGNMVIAQRLASLDMEGGEGGRAVERFESVLRANPKSVAATLAILELKVRSQTPQAELQKLIKDALSQNPGSPALRVALARLQLAERNYKSAQDVLQEGLAAEPNNPELLQTMAQLQTAAGDGNQALKTMHRVVALQPTEPAHLVFLAELQSSQGDDKSAGVSLTKALELKKDYLPAQIRLSRMRAAQGQLGQTREIIRQIQAQRPDEGIGYALEGELALREKSPDRAIAAFRQSLQKVKSAEVAIRLHKILSETGKQSQAVELEKTWLREQPRDSLFLLYAGETALKRNDQKTSLDYFREMLKRQPNNPLAMNNVAWLMQQLKLPGALDLAEKATLLAPRQPAFMDTKAEILAANGRVKEALKIQKEAVGLAPKMHVYRLHLAEYYLQSGMKAEARTELEAMDSLGDAMPLRAEVKRLLASL
jgi:cellulose synthase operon protein C